MWIDVQIMAQKGSLGFFQHENEPLKMLGAQAAHRVALFPPALLVINVNECTIQGAKGPSRRQNDSMKGT